MGKLQIPNDIAFRALWRSDKSTKEIARIYDVAPESISAAGQRYGYQTRAGAPRQTGMGRGPRRVFREPETPDSLPPVMRADPSPLWSRAEDLAIFQTGGKYKAMRLLATIYDTTAARIQARWQQLRSMK